MGLVSSFYKPLFSYEPHLFPISRQPFVPLGQIFLPCPVFVSYPLASVSVVEINLCTKNLVLRCFELILMFLILPMKPVLPF